MAETLKRNDPPSRPTDGDLQAKIVNKDPNRWYILANPNDDWCGVAEMLNLGFEIERPRKDGPKIAGGRASAEGDRIELRGNVLMSCPLEVYKQRYEEGQRRADLIDEAIGRPGGIDGLRGTTGRLAENNTTKEVVNLS